MSKSLIFIWMALLCMNVHAQVPSAKVETITGEKVDIRDMLKDKVTVISFWSSVCKPCIAELDAINDVIADWHSKVNFQMIIIAIDDSRSLAKAKSLVNGHDWNYIALFDKNQDMKRSFGVNFIPHVFVFDTNGKQVYSHTGYSPGGEDDVFNAIQKIQKH
jgi:cytochrome c biogenesis protein CcmG/thiol:disulfide interchange protein DsbE